MEHFASGMKSIIFKNQVLHTLDWISYDGIRITEIK